MLRTLLQSSKRLASSLPVLSQASFSTSKDANPKASLPLGVELSPDFPLLSPDQFDRPSFTWSPESKGLFSSFVSDGYVPKLFAPDPRNFTAGGPNPERRIFYQLFFKPGPAFGAERSHPSANLYPQFPSKMIDGELPEGELDNPLGNTIGVFYFGPDALGPTGTVHGGAIASAADTIMGMSMTYCDIPRVTAKLEINYRSLTPTPGYAIGRARVHSRIGRKAVVLFDFRSLDGKILYNEGWALFISPKQEPSSSA